MATTTAVFGWRVPELTDDPNIPQDMVNLADDVESTVTGTTTVGVPGSASITLDPSAFTELCSVSFTLPVAQQVEIVGWARLLNTGSTRPILALQVLDGLTHLFGTGQVDAAGTGDNYGADVFLTTSRRKFSMTAGAHTLHLQAWKDSNGTIAAKKTSTFGTQDVAVTGIEASY
jgi:hypothetical protein